MTDKRVHDVPLFRRKKIGDKVLVSNDLGGWAMLSREDFNSFTHPDLHKNPKL
ncbi:MAG: hypothetical protein GOV00_04330, partial [Candidatus Altiarchaeota archaeon]|nr:hypothetical protein [Candidatus Altiarchaeota archaeon]